MDRATADYMGMLATVLNALTVQDALERPRTYTRCSRRSPSPRSRSPTSAAGRFGTREGARGDLRRRDRQPVLHDRHGGGAAALEIHAEAILMAKHGVEGVLTPTLEVPDAKFLPEITHMEAIERGLRVMDSTALSLCMDNALPIHVFNMADERNIDRIVGGERVGTIVDSGERRETLNCRRLGAPDVGGEGDRPLSGVDRRVPRRRQGADGQVRGGLPPRAGHRLHGPGLPAPARPPDRRLLRRRDADQAACTGRRDRRAPADAHPFDKNSIGTIEKAIMESDLGSPRTTTAT